MLNRSWHFSLADFGFFSQPTPQRVGGLADQRGSTGFFRAIGRLFRHVVCPFRVKYRLKRTRLNKATQKRLDRRESFILGDGKRGEMEKQIKEERNKRTRRIYLCERRRGEREERCRRCNLRGQGTILLRDDPQFFKAVIRFSRSPIFSFENFLEEFLSRKVYHV